MSSRLTFAAAILACGLAAPLAAQEAGPPSPQPTVNVNRLGIDVNRIHRQLQQDAERGPHEGLRLKYFIDVYASSPRLQLFANRQEATTGPVPFGAPTHREMLDVTTPQEYRAPVMDFGALMRWFSDRASSK